MKKIILTFVLCNFYHIINAQEISLKVKSCKIITQSDFKGKDSELNGKYISGTFEIMNKSNDTLIFPNMLRLNDWSNNHIDKLYFYKIKKPYFLIEIEEKIVGKNEQEIISHEIISNELEMLTEEVEAFTTNLNNSYNGDKLNMDYSTKAIYPNEKEAFYFLKKTYNSNFEINIKITYNTLFLDKKKLKKESQQRKKSVEKERNILKKEIKSLEDTISKYSTKSIKGRVTSYSIKVKPGTKEYKEYIKAFDRKGRLESFGNYEEESIINHLENLIKITPLKLISEKYTQKIE